TVVVVAGAIYVAVVVARTVRIVGGPVVGRIGVVIAVVVIVVVVAAGRERAADGRACRQTVAGAHAVSENRVPPTPARIAARADIATARDTDASTRNADAAAGDARASAAAHIGHAHER